MLKLSFVAAVAKRRVSTDLPVDFPKPKSPLPPPTAATQPFVLERPARSKGGKPPLDVIQQNTEKIMTPREASSLKKVTSPERSKSGKNSRS